MVYGFILYTFEIKILCDLLKDNHKKFRVHESIALTYQFRRNPWHIRQITSAKPLFLSHLSDSQSNFLIHSFFLLLFFIKAQTCYSIIPRKSLYSFFITHPFYGMKALLFSNFIKIYAFILKNLALMHICPFWKPITLYCFWSGTVGKAQR